VNELWPVKVLLRQTAMVTKGHFLESGILASGDRDANLLQ